MRSAVLDRASQPVRNMCRTSIKVDLTGIALSTGGTGPSSAYRSLTRPTTGGPNGGAFARVTFLQAYTPVAGDAMSVQAVGWNAAGASIGAACPVTPGRKVVVSLWVRSSIAQKVRLQAQMVTLTGGALGTNQGADTTLVPNVWTRFAVPATPGTDATGVRIDFDIASSPLAWSVNDTLDMAMPMVVENDTDLGWYADGDVPGWLWTGTSGLSESVGYPYTLEAIAGAPAVTVLGVGAVVLPGATGASARTMYLVHDNSSVVSSGSITAARFGSEIIGSSRARMTYIQTGLNGDYFNQSDVQYIASVAGAMTVGRHVGMLRLPSGLTQVTAGLDGAIGAPTGITTPTNFTDQNVRTYGNGPNTPVIAIAYNADHDDATAKRITAWLARRYGSPIPTGY